MGENARAIIGWDLGGNEAHELPCQPGELVLVNANRSFVLGEGSRTVAFDVWGFDPKLNVVVYFSRVQSTSAAVDVEGDYNELPTTNITATLQAFTLTRSRGNVLVGAPVTADLFSNGGKLDSQYDDGAEFVTGVQGIRFKLTATRTAGTSCDIIAQIQAKPNVALHCEALAQKLIANLQVGRPAAVGW